MTSQLLLAVDLVRPRSLHKRTLDLSATTLSLDVKALSPAHDSSLATGLCPWASLGLSGLATSILAANASSRATSVAFEAELLQPLPTSQHVSRKRQVPPENEQQSTGHVSTPAALANFTSSDECETRQSPEKRPRAWKEQPVAGFCSELNEVFKHKELLQQFQIPTATPLAKGDRSELIEWICDACDSANLQPVTKHSAIVLNDLYINRFATEEQQLQLVALCSILIAAKLEETEDNLPKIDTLNETANNAYSRDNILVMESLMLQRLNWRVTIVTPLHFVSLYLNHPDFFANSGDAELVHYLSLAAFFFVDFCLRVYELSLYPPSLIAAAALVSARRMLQRNQLYPNVLGTISGFSKRDIMSCHEAVWRNYVCCEWPAQRK